MRAAGMSWMMVGVGLLARPALATVDLNQATASQMEQELGLTRSEAIQVIERRERTPFQSPDELAQLDGIDAQKAAQLKGKLSATAPEKPAKPTKSKKSGKKRSGRKAGKPRAPKAAPQSSSAHRGMLGQRPPPQWASSTGPTVVHGFRGSWGGGHPGVVRGRH